MLKLNYNYILYLIYNNSFISNMFIHNDTIDNKYIKLYYIYYYKLLSNIFYCNNLYFYDNPVIFNYSNTSTFILLEYIIRFKKQYYFLSNYFVNCKKKIYRLNDFILRINSNFGFTLGKYNEYIRIFKYNEYIRYTAKNIKVFESLSTIRLDAQDLFNYYRRNFIYNKFVMYNYNKTLYNQSNVYVFNNNIISYYIKRKQMIFMNSLIIHLFNSIFYKFYYIIILSTVYNNYLFNRVPIYFKRRIRYFSLRYLYRFFVTVKYDWSKDIKINYAIKFRNFIYRNF